MPEELIWEQIKDKKMGVEFNMKCSDGKYKFDFLCVQKRLVVEIKGQKSLQEFYNLNSDYLKQSGYQFLLLSHEEVITDLNKAVAKIAESH
jgi:very-short-patch-repair endonuclease